MYVCANATTLQIPCTCYLVIKRILSLFLSLILCVIFVGGSCNRDFDGCADSPCTAGTNCTDLSPADEQMYGTAFNCSQCPKGYEENDGICIGMYQIYLDFKLFCIHIF